MAVPVVAIGGVLLLLALLGGWALRARRTAGSHAGQRRGTGSGPHLINRSQLSVVRDENAAAGQAPVREAVTGLTKTQAEELLDWLQGNGYSGFEVACDESGFTVRRSESEQTQRS
jgi:hypothetical protein